METAVTQTVVKCSHVVRQAAEIDEGLQCIGHDRLGSAQHALSYDEPASLMFCCCSCSCSVPKWTRRQWPHFPGSYKIRNPHLLDITLAWIAILQLLLHNHRMKRHGGTVHPSGTVCYCEHKPLQRARAMPSTQSERRVLQRTGVAHVDNALLSVSRS